MSRRTSELTGRGDTKQVWPDKVSCETRDPRSGPTICSAALTWASTRSAFNPTTIQASSALVVSQPRQAGFKKRGAIQLTQLNRSSVEGN
jgi:hypothetical protein